MNDNCVDVDVLALKLLSNKIDLAERGVKRQATIEVQRFSANSMQCIVLPSQSFIFRGDSSAPHSPLLYSSKLFYILLYSSIPFRTFLYSTILFRTLLYSSIFFYILLYSSILFYTLLYSSVYSSILFYNLQYSSILFCTLLYSSILFRILFYTLLYSSILLQCIISQAFSSYIPLVILSLTNQCKITV